MQVAVVVEQVAMAAPVAHEECRAVGGQGRRALAKGCGLGTPQFVPQTLCLLSILLARKQRSQPRLLPFFSLLLSAHSNYPSNPSIEGKWVTRRLT